MVAMAVAGWLAELAATAAARVALAAAAPRAALASSVAVEKAEVGWGGLAVDSTVATAVPEAAGRAVGWEAMASATVARRAAPAAQKEGATGAVALEGR